MNTIPVSVFLKRYILVLLMPAFLLAGCGVTTKKTFLDEPVQPTVGNAVPVSSDSGQSDQLAENPALNSADATGVQRLLNIITPYRTNIQQGNFISQEMLARLQVGMTKEQVRFALGTPLLTDMFHASRWDYIFRLQKPTGHVTNNRVVIYFEDNRVSRILNDPLPEEVEYLETIAGPVAASKLKKLDEDQLKEKEEERVVSKPPESVEPSVESVPSEERHQPVKSGQSKEPQSVESPQSEDHQPIEPVQPEEHYQPIEPVQSEEHYQPIEPVQSEEHYQSIEPVQSEEHYQSEESVQPIESHQPNQPIQLESVKSTSVDQPSVQSSQPYQPQRQRAKTIQTEIDAPPDDGRATPNSTMQLHQLMQIQ